MSSLLTSFGNFVSIKCKHQSSSVNYGGDVVCTSCLQILRSSDLVALSDDEEVKDTFNLRCSNDENS